MKSKNQDTLDFMRNIIGEEKFMEVSSALAGERITFPRSYQLMGKKERNQAILIEFYEGSSIPELAEKYDLSESHVYKIVERQH